MEPGGAAGAGHRAGQVGWDDDVAEPQRREQRLAEGTDVDDPAVGVETLQAGHRLRAVVEAAVVVVLDDPGAGAAGPGEQRQPSRQRHRHAERELVRRRHVGQAGLGRAPDAGCDVEPARRRQGPGRCGRRRQSTPSARRDSRAPRAMPCRPGRAARGRSARGRAGRRRRQSPGRRCTPRRARAARARRWRCAAAARRRNRGSRAGRA